MSKKLKIVITPKIGDRIIMQSDNARKMKDRGRIGTVVELEDHFLPSWIKAKFDDTKRVKQISIFDISIFRDWYNLFQ